jgi:hypothetical protein
VEPKDDNSNRYSVEFLSIEELRFIQNCIVYSCCSLQGNLPEMIAAIQEIDRVSNIVDIEGIEKRILTAAGIDISQIGNPKPGEVVVIPYAKSKTNVVINNEETSKIIQ